MLFIQSSPAAALCYCLLIYPTASDQWQWGSSAVGQTWHFVNQQHNNCVETEQICDWELSTQLLERKLFFFFFVKPSFYFISQNWLHFLTRLSVICFFLLGKSVEVWHSDISQVTMSCGKKSPQISTRHSSSFMFFWLIFKTFYFADFWSGESIELHKRLQIYLGHWDLQGLSLIEILILTALRNKIQ